MVAQEATCMRSSYLGYMYHPFHEQFLLISYELLLQQAGYK
uniref:Uncharacterized protein n=1 Tax=Arundo donax TaxID=35708 RepID=A0A0A9EEF2_ARUDO